MSAVRVVPRLVESFVDARAKNGYRRVYSFLAPAGTVLVQEVRTRVRYLCGEEPLAEFRSVYGEFFALGDEEALLADEDELRDMRDVHAFDLRRDGWSLSALRDLLRRQRVRGADGRPYAPGGPTQVDCEKRFVLAPGVVEDSPPLKVNGGQGFGFLLEGPREVACARLDLNGGAGGTRRSLEPRSPFPYGSDGAGRGWFAGAEALELVERFAFTFATDSLRFDDGGGYRPVSLAAAD